MSAPKPGDRVRVTIEGTIGQFGNMSLVLGFGKTSWTITIPPGATVEVLASPVYVNHDTTEYRVGDIVRNHCDTVFVRTARGVWQAVLSGACYEDFVMVEPENLTLLVRDGQVIAP